MWAHRRIAHVKNHVRMGVWDGVCDARGGGSGNEVERRYFAGEVKYYICIFLQLAVGILHYGCNQSRRETNQTETHAGETGGIKVHRKDDVEMEYSTP